MLSFRPEQVEFLGAAAATQFVGRLLGFIRAELQEYAAGFDEAALEAFVVDQNSVARRYRINTESGLASFVCLSLLAGQSIDKVPAIRKGLLASGDPELFVELLLNATT